VGDRVLGYGLKVVVVLLVLPDVADGRAMVVVPSFWTPAFVPVHGIQKGADKGMAGGLQRLVH
jgi:hypothetical protein